MAGPESRGDLEALTRMSVEQFSAAFGVPSDLIFSGRFAGKSTSQSLLRHSRLKVIEYHFIGLCFVCSDFLC